jgi:hypothetical protein
MRQSELGCTRSHISAVRAGGVIETRSVGGVFLLVSIASRGVCLACFKVEAFRDSGRACRPAVRFGETLGGVSTAMIVQMTAAVLAGHQHVSNGTVTTIPEALRC